MSEVSVDDVANSMYELVKSTYKKKNLKPGDLIKAMIDHDLAPVLLGKDGTAIAELYDFMEWHIHYVGRGGIASLAVTMQ